MPNVSKINIVENTIKERRSMTDASHSYSRLINARVGNELASFSATIDLCCLSTADLNDPPFIGFFAGSLVPSSRLFVRGDSSLLPESRRRFLV